MTEKQKARLALAREVEHQAAIDHAVAEYALVMEALMLARQVADDPRLAPLAALVRRREAAQQAHVAAMRAYRRVVADLGIPPSTETHDA